MGNVGPRSAITFLKAAQPSSPRVPVMNAQTIILSLLLSRWKHMVVTSSSVASLQKSMPCLRQKALVHSEHDLDFERGSSSIVGRSTDRRRVSSLGPSGMMVLFLKHVHLQKVGAAGRC